MEAIKSLDIFGYEVRLNFNSKGSTYTTLFGALMSLLFYLIVILSILLAVSAEGSTFLS